MTKKIHSNIKVFFIDLDGTTLDTKNDFGHWISQRNIDAIKKSRSEGKEIIISTGRSLESVRKIYEVVGGKYLIQANGAIISDSKGKTIFETFISVRDLHLLNKIFIKYKLGIKINDDSCAYGVKRLFSKIVCKIIGWSKNKGYSYDLQKEYFKILCFGFFSKKKIEKISDEIEKKVKNISVVTSANGHVIEITSKEASKGIAARKVLGLIGIKRENSAHVGDSMNDYSAINHVGQLIIMKNASKKLKRRVAYIGPKYKKGGVAKVLEGKYSKVS